MKESVSGEVTTNGRLGNQERDVCKAPSLAIENDDERQIHAVHNLVMILVQAV